jgi:ABC-type nickel/cobalt efflux system permease component RcnA
VEASFFAILGLGFLLGLKHATEPDHVVAVTTFVSRETSLLRSCWIGLFWGAGHTLSLALAGAIIILFKISISDTATAWLELGVAGMLVTLGARALYHTWKDKLQFHRHAHAHVQGKAPHVHWHLHVHGKLDEHTGWLHVGLRPLLVGVVHGAAGTGALMLLVFSTIHSPLRALLYIVIFGAGSIAGMLIVSFLLAVPFQWASRRVASSYRWVQASAGMFSCVFGMYLGLEIWQKLGL